MHSSNAFDFSDHSELFLRLSSIDSCIKTVIITLIINADITVIMISNVSPNAWAWSGVGAWSSKTATLPRKPLEILPNDLSLK